MLCVLSSNVVWHTLTLNLRSWAQFCCKMWGDSLVWNQYSHPIDAEVTFYTQIPNLISRGVLRAKLITLCFVLADGLHINNIKCFSCTFPFFERATNIFNVTGHQACSPTRITISIDILLPATKAFGLKLAQPTSRMISIYFYCRWAEDESFQSPLVAPCIHTHTELQKGLILKPEPSPNTAGAWHLLLKPDLCLKAKFTEGVEICATAE